MLRFSQEETILRFTYFKLKHVGLDRITPAKTAVDPLVENELAVNQKHRRRHKRKAAHYRGKETNVANEVFLYYQLYWARD